MSDEKSTLQIVSYLDNPIAAGGVKIMPTPEDKQSGAMTPADGPGKEDVVNKLTGEEWRRFIDNDAFRIMVHAGKLRAYVVRSKAKQDWLKKKAQKREERAKNKKSPKPPKNTPTPAPSN